MKFTISICAVAMSLIFVSGHAALSGPNDAPLVAGQKAGFSRPLILANSQLSCPTAKSQCEDNCGNGDPPNCQSMPGGCGAQKPTPKWKRCIARCQEVFSAC